MKKMMYISLISFLFSSLTSFQSYAVEGSCVDALSLMQELRNFYTAREAFLKAPSYDKSDQVGILYEALGDKAGAILNPKLHIAASENDVSKIKYLISSGVPVDIRGQAGMTPLSVAAGYGHIEAIDVLLELGADINAPDALGRSPLSYAAVGGHDRAIEHLLENNAEIDQADIMNITPIMEAVRYDHQNVVRVLASHGADLMSKNILGWTLLHTAIFYLEVVDRVDMVETILDTVRTFANWPEPGIINWPTPVAKASPLHWAVFYGRTDVVDVLLQRGASLTSINEDGELPIHVAARGDQKDAFLKLKDANPESLKAKDNKGRTPIDTAREHNSQNVLSAF